MGKGSSTATTAGIQSDTTALTQIALGQAQNANSLFQSSMPGFQTAESFYSALASGDPYAIARATAPENQQITAASTSAKQNIQNNNPAGGEKNLALENVDVSQGAQVGKAATSGYTGSFNALAQLSGQGVGEALGGTSQAITGLNSANSGLSTIAGLQAEQKGNSLGAFASLGGDAATLAGLALA